jgi:hypothetical protein
VGVAVEVWTESGPVVQFGGCGPQARNTAPSLVLSNLSEPYFMPIIIIGWQVVDVIDAV